MKKQILMEIISALLILLFLYASTSKLVDLKGFAGDMRNQVFPLWMANNLVWAVPSAEIGICALLIFERSRLAGLYGSLIIMSLFTIYSATVLFHWYGRIPCSCGGVIRKLSWREHIVFNLFYVALSIIGIKLQLDKLSKKNLKPLTNFPTST